MDQLEGNRSISSSAQLLVAYPLPLLAEVDKEVSIREGGEALVSPQLQFSIATKEWGHTQRLGRASGSEVRKRLSYLLNTSAKTRKCRPRLRNPSTQESSENQILCTCFQEAHQDGNLRTRCPHTEDALRRTSTLSFRTRLRTGYLQLHTFTKVIRKLIMS